MLPHVQQAGFVCNAPVPDCGMGSITSAASGSAEPPGRATRYSSVKLSPLPATVKTCNHRLAEANCCQWWRALDLSGSQCRQFARYVLEAGS